MKTFKRICSLLTVVAMLLTMVMATPVMAEDRLDVSISLTAPEGEIKAGDSIAIPVVLSDRIGMKGAAFRIKWNPEYLSMSSSFVEDEDTGEKTYDAYTDKPALFNDQFTINLNNLANGELTVIGSKKGSAYSSTSANFPIGTLHFTVLDAAKGKDVTISFIETTEAGEKKTYGNNGSADIFFASTTGTTFAVVGDVVVVEPEIKGITVTANAVEIADADKADEAKIIAAVKAAITAIKAQWTEGKADTDVAIDDVTITVDTAATKATVAYEGFTADVTYTVAAPIPVMSGITATADGVEIAYADKDNVDVIKAAIANALTVKAQWTEGKADTDVAVADVEITVDTAATKATVAYNGFTADVIYTVAAKPIEYYTVTLKAEGAEDVVITVEEGTTIGDQMPADPTNGTLAFDGWFDAEDNEITAETVVNGDIVATAKFSRIVGDVNCDGVKDSKDAIYLLNHCALPDLYPVDDYEYTLDMNGDGVVSSLDAIYLLNSIAIPALYSLAW